MPSKAGKRRIKPEVAKEWLATSFNDIGIALLAASFVLNFMELRFWSSIIFGILFIVIGLRYKFMNKNEFADITKNVKNRPTNRLDVVLFILVSVMLLLTHNYMPFIYSIIMTSFYFLVLPKLLKWAIG